MAVSNQNIVRIGVRDTFDKSHTYCLMHIDSLQEAMCNLKGETLKLWLYCNKNQDNYQFELSQKALQDWGLKKDAYQTAKKKLVELGYLVPASEDSNILIFYESPLSEKQTKLVKPVESGFQIESEKPTNQSEKQTMIAEEIGSEKPTSSEIQTKLETSESEKPTKCLGKMSEKPTTLSGFPTSQSEKAQRNNTIVHDSTLKDSTNTTFDEREEERSDSYPTISRDVVEQIFVNPEYLEGGLIKNGDKIFRLEN